jgi:hypothetical protein
MNYFWSITSVCSNNCSAGAKSHLRGDLDFNKISIKFYPSGNFGRPHVLFCPGLAVYLCGFALDAAELQPLKLLQHRGSSWTALDKIIGKVGPEVKKIKSLWIVPGS